MRTLPVLFAPLVLFLCGCACFTLSIPGAGNSIRCWQQDTCALGTPEDVMFFVLVIGIGTIVSLGFGFLAWSGLNAEITEIGKDLRSPQ